MYLGSFHQSVSVVYANYNYSSPTLPPLTILLLPVILFYFQFQFTN